MRLTAVLSILAVCGFVGSASAGQLIAVDSTRNLYEIDAATGAKTLIGTVSSFVGTTAGLARNPANGTIYVTSATTDTLYTIDVGTGSATVIGGYGTTSVVMHGLEWDSVQNTLWGGSGGNLYHINPANGFASLVGLSGLSAFLNLGYVPGANVLYGTNNGTDSLYQVDRNTGVLTLVGPLGMGPTNPSALAYDSENSVLYMLDANSDSLYTVDPATGAAALVGSTGSGRPPRSRVHPRDCTAHPLLLRGWHRHGLPVRQRGHTGQRLRKLRKPFGREPHDRRLGHHQRRYAAPARQRDAEQLGALLPGHDPGVRRRRRPVRRRAALRERGDRAPGHEEQCRRREPVPDRR